MTHKYCYYIYQSPDAPISPEDLKHEFGNLQTALRLGLAGHDPDVDVTVEPAEEFEARIVTIRTRLSEDEADSLVNKRLGEVINRFGGVAGRRYTPALLCEMR